MKAIRQAQTREILDAYNREDISYSRINEMFNELAEKFAIEFAEWVNLNAYKYPTKTTTQQLLEIFKQEKK